MTTGSDEELARQVQAGSMAAFEELVCRYEKRIFAFASRAHRGADAQEVAQETFVRAFRAIGHYNPCQPFAPWLFTIAHRKSIDLYRAAPPPATEPLPELLDPTNPAELLAQREDRDALWHLARKRLPDMQFQALWLKYAESLDVAAIARVLHKTRTHVKVLLFRARQKLAAELAQHAALNTPHAPAAPHAAPAPPPLRSTLSVSSL